MFKVSAIPFNRIVHPSSPNTQATGGRIYSQPVLEDTVHFSGQLRHSKGQILLKSAKIGDVKTLQAFLADKEVRNRVNTIKNSWGHTALMEAAMQNQIEAMKLLREQGAKLHITSNSGVDALDLAVMFGHAEATDYLLNESKSDTRYEPWEERLPELAVEFSGSLPVMQVLSRHGFKLPTEGSPKQLFMGHPEVAKGLLELNEGSLDPGVHVPEGFQCLLEHVKPKVIRRLIMDDQNEILASLLSLPGAFNVNTPDEFGLPPLAWAAMAEKPEISRLLIQHGAKVNPTIKNVHRPDPEKIEISVEDTPLLFPVIYWRNIKAAEVLWEHGARLPEEQLNQLLYLSLSTDSQKTDTRMIDFLLERGADINTKGRYPDTTPLSAALKFRDQKALGHLLSRGAEIRQPAVLRYSNIYDDFALDPENDHADKDRRIREMTLMLVEHGMNLHEPIWLERDYPFAKTMNHSTPLMWAAFFGNPVLTDVLLERGVDLSARNSKGMTALDIALKERKELVAGRMNHRYQDFERVIERLKDAGCKPSSPLNKLKHRFS